MIFSPSWPAADFWKKKLNKSVKRFKMGQCPFFPKPHKNKASTLLTFLLKRRSWLDGLYERSYKMQAGEVRMPNFSLYVINDTKEVRKILIEKTQIFPKSALLHELLKPLLGESIFTTNGEIWKKQRELLKPSFEHTKINKIFPLMRAAVDDMMQRFSLREHDFIEVDEEMSFTTADVIFRTILSEKLDSKQGKEILQAFSIFQSQSVRSAMRRMFGFPKWLSLLFGEAKRIRAGEVIRKNLSQIIKPRFEESRKNPKNDKNFDILSALLMAEDTKSGQKFSFEEILDQVAMLFLAGHETTASALTWTLYCLSLFPKWQEKARDEIFSVLKNEQISAQNLAQFKHLKNIFKEALRLYPPVGFFARTANENIKIRDKEVKKDSGVVVATWLIQRHENFWENPHYFDPSRFEREFKKDAFLPFGAGERICIGQAFAMQEALLILANLLIKYKLELKSGFVPDVVGRLTVRSANGMKIKFIKI